MQVVPEKTDEFDDAHSASPTEREFTSPFSQHAADGSVIMSVPILSLLYNTQAVGDELHYVLDCPRFGAIRAQYSNLFQDAEGSMRLFMRHKDQKAVSHCLTAILQMAQT